MSSNVVGPDGRLVPRIVEREDRCDALLWQLVELEVKATLPIGLTAHELERAERMHSMFLRWAKTREFENASSRDDAAVILDIVRERIGLEP